MQRVDPRPMDPPPQSQSQEQQQSNKLNMPTGFASTGSQPHTQSFEEIYGVPENFLEIEVPSTFTTSSYMRSRPVKRGETPDHKTVVIDDRNANTSTPGHRPANPPTNLLPQLKIHNLSDPPQHQHPRLQTPTLRSPPPLLRLRSLPRPARARIRARLHPALTRQSLPQPLRRQRNRGAAARARKVPEDRGWTSAAPDGK